MAFFITRVELHGASHDDYESLHSAMEAGGFSRRIVADDGRIYHLPTAEYFAQGEYTADAVREAASRIATGIGRPYAILTCRTDHIAYQGLAAA